MEGRIIAGKYKIIESIGTGGMAHVYKAEQILAPHRLVAIKLPKDEYIKDAAFLRRFETEANAVLVLSHENIVRSRDVGHDGDVPYIALEYVEGRTLKQIIQERGSLTTKQVVNLGAQVLDACSHAHDKNIIHRDIKPQNIIINKRGRVKLADFGIARMNCAGDTMTFANSGILGSVHYISPEQATGKPVTVESDIYSVGVTLYEMATGRVPYSNSSSVAVALMHVQDELIPPNEVNPDIPPALNDVIVKALQKKPNMRYRNARKMRRDLIRVLREPKGDYAKLKSAEDIVNKKKTTRGILRIAALTALILAFMGGLFSAGRAMLNSMTKANSSVLAPTLVGKSMDEAERLAKLRGFTLDLNEHIASDEVEAGLILFQSPDAGSEVPNGVISVALSAGGAMQTSVPDVTGVTLAEAELILEEYGLVAGNIDYRTSEYPSGQVFKQDPAEGGVLLEGDAVALIVSGVPTRNLEAPDALEKELSTALNLFVERGFTKFRVRYGEISENPGTITRQTPTKGELGNPDTTVSLTMAISEWPEYLIILPLAMDVAQDETNLIITTEQELEGIPYELVLHEQLLKAGKHELSIELPAFEPGIVDLVVYLNSQEYSRLPAMAASAPKSEGGEE